MRENEVKVGEMGEAEATLRLIAKLPAPEGLVGRVQSGLRAAPKDARVLDWPVVAESSHSWLNGWVRGAAAAAIVCLVAGGAWQISLRMVPAGGGNATAAPVRVRPAGGFSSAGAMRTPDTLNGPVLKQEQKKKAEDVKKKGGSEKKSAEAGPR